MQIRTWTFRAKSSAHSNFFPKFSLNSVGIIYWNQQHARNKFQWQEHQLYRPSTFHIALLLLKTEKETCGRQFNITSIVYLSPVAAKSYENEATSGFSQVLQLVFSVSNRLDDCFTILLPLRVWMNRKFSRWFLWVIQLKELESDVWIQRKIFLAKFSPQI